MTSLDKRARDVAEELIHVLAGDLWSEEAAPLILTALHKAREEALEDAAKEMDARADRRADSKYEAQQVGNDVLACHHEDKQGAYRMAAMYLTAQADKEIER